MRRPVLLFISVALVLFVVMWGHGALFSSYGYGGWGMMGRGMWGYGPGMMYGDGLARSGWWCRVVWCAGWRELNLTDDDVKNELDRRLAWQGNSHVKIGNVVEKDADTVVADIVTKDGSLVQRFNVNRHDGFWRQSED